uniref:Cation efflux protein transmembrane domain-containing protein n=1 Tax=Corethron hystrix TaxID=216773 RepID=A0A7S1BVH4_9STRA|mmetsp:Transcript_4066/g.7821  ORF Transcript_4066/g.7821 Transcript_4066/m.7821 type:complete len:362 (+) Transcript_4066:86-1171(+)
MQPDFTSEKINLSSKCKYESPKLGEESIPNRQDYNSIPQRDNVTAPKNPLGNGNCVSVTDKRHEKYVERRNDDIEIASDPDDAAPNFWRQCYKLRFCSLEQCRTAMVVISLIFNILILLTKCRAYVITFSLSVLAALMDSALDVMSQFILYYFERESKEKSFDLYPAGRSRLEPVGVIMCAALMGMASFEVLKRTAVTLYDAFRDGGQPPIIETDMSSMKSMIYVVVIKLVLYVLCKLSVRETANVKDASMEALAQDHLNDSLSNTVAAIALIVEIISPSSWLIDPIGAIFISLYIIMSWYYTGKEQIEHLAGRSAPPDFIDELRQIASNHHSFMAVDVCRAYHFGPKYMVELEVRTYWPV